MERVKQHLQCPICLKRVLITIDVPQTHPSFTAAVCSNEAFAHVGNILYRASDIFEPQEKQSELILN